MGGNDRFSVERLANDTSVTAAMNVNDCTTNETSVFNVDSTNVSSSCSSPATTRNYSF